MITIAAEHIEDWRGRQVLDPDDATLGKCQEIWFDTPTNTPILLSIKSGLLGRHIKMIPIDGAVVGPDYVRVAFKEAAVKESPNADGEDPPNALELDEIGKAYDLRFSEKIRLESATAIAQKRAEAEAARVRAEEAETAAREKAAAAQEAESRAGGASAEAERAKREAEEASQAARRARVDVERTSGDT